MTSGYETLSQLTPESYDYFNELGDILETGLKEVFSKHNVPITVNRLWFNDRVFLKPRASD